MHSFAASLLMTILPFACTISLYKIFGVFLFISLVCFGLVLVVWLLLKDFAVPLYDTRDSFPVVKASDFFFSLV